jgi:hypothetical protein
MADDSCPFGDGALLESRASRGSFQTLRPLAEGTQFFRTMDALYRHMAELYEIQLC